MDNNRAPTSTDVGASSVPEYGSLVGHTAHEILSRPEAPVRWLVPGMAAFGALTTLGRLRGRGQDAARPSAGPVGQARGAIPGAVGNDASRGGPRGLPDRGASLLVRPALRDAGVGAHAHTVNVPVFPDPARGLEQDVCGKRAPQMTGLAGSGPRRRSKWCSGRAV